MIKSRLSTKRTGEIARKIVSLGYRASPKWLVGSVFINILHGATFALISICTSKFLNTVANGLQNDLPLFHVLGSLLEMLIIYILNQVVNAIANYSEETYVDVGMGHLQYTLNCKVQEYTAIFFEKEEYLDSVHKAEQGQKGVLQFVQTCILLATFYPAYFGLIAIFFIEINPILLICVPLTFIPTCINYYRSIKKHSVLTDKLAALQRQNEFFMDCCMEREYFVDTRQLGAFSYFINQYGENLAVMNDAIGKQTKQNTRFDLCAKSFSAVCYCLIISVLIFSLFTSKISAGEFIAILSSIGMMFDICEEAIFRYAASIPSNFSSMTKYVDFIMQKVEEKGTTHFIDTEENEVVLENVSFSYPSAEKPVLRNVNISIRKGDVIAIVGENGSGKTTLAKIVCGIYTPSQGIRYVNRATKFTALFQKFQRYKLSLYNNVIISELVKSFRSKENTINEVDIALSTSGLNNLTSINKDTILSPAFGGKDLSGGQWQKLALSRAIYRDANFVVLDEPTSAIDPLEEDEMYRRFSEILRGRTGIIITHRLGVVKISNRVILMQNGEIIADGSHQNLLATCEEYQRIYLTQADWMTK